MPPVHSGIDYLALVAAEHAQATRRSINFADILTDCGGQAVAWDEPTLPFPDRPEDDSADADDAARQAVAR
jgi:hypothetical protein